MSLPPTLHTLAWDEPVGASRYLLHPGDVCCGTRGDIFETLLGSCVAVIMTDPKRTVAAMCHIVHTGRSPNNSCLDSTYGEGALHVMQALLRERGIEPRLCEAYVYGGGNMFPVLFPEGHIGINNARWTLQALEQLGVKVIDQDLGGTRYRKICWTVSIEPPRVASNTA